MRILREGPNYICDVQLHVMLKEELLSLTEDTVDLSSADWADALCHAAT